MCTTVPSTLLAKHDVEKIKTIRPLNTSPEPTSRKQTTENSEGRRGGGDELSAYKPAVSANMGKVPKKVFFFFFK